ncbi:Mitochondrial import inner membrane translocase subunit TIM44 [Trichoplax sp. H2]|nr:Mitochondrial import inner membrane translocase subunit TIM44 [Trichoplax sp. H2]|eukprot:RDD46341.1 Mitochondrial import inner membrane translocase subunit TIM44 [Trichoplax sp. H2]
MSNKQNQGQVLVKEVRIMGQQHRPSQVISVLLIGLTNRAQPTRSRLIPISAPFIQRSHIQSKILPYSVQHHALKLVGHSTFQSWNNNIRGTIRRNFSNQGQKEKGLFSKVFDNIKEGFAKNKELQENIKKFREEAAKLEQSEAYKKISDATEDLGSGAADRKAKLGTFLSKFRTSAGKLYEDVSSSDFVKKGKEVSEDLSNVASEAAKKVSDSSKSVGETQTFKTFSEGVKTIKEDLFEEGLNRAQPYRSPEKLHKRTESDLQSKMKDEQQIQEDTDTTGVVLHKDSRWYQQWKQFKDNNPVVNGLFNLKMKYDESDNVVIRATRVVTDRLSDAFSGIFSPSEMSQTLAEISKIDPNFSKEKFLLHFQHRIMPSVLEAFLRGDLPILKDWCHESAYSVLEARIKQLTGMGRKLDFKVLDVRDIDIAMAKIMEQGPVLVMTFQAQQILVLRDSSGKVVEGDENHIENVQYVWAMCRDQSIYDAHSAWRVLEFAMQASSSWV